MRKYFSLALTLLLMVSTLIMLKPALGVTKPSVPEFSLTLTEKPFDVPPIYRIDAYTGENVTVQTGYRLQNRSIDVIIKNQPFTPYRDSSGNHIDLYYNVRSKGRFQNEWYYYPYCGRLLPIAASNSNYTVLSFSLESALSSYAQYFFTLGDVPAGGQVDFQVQASIVYYADLLFKTTLSDNAFTGETSEWSSTQTITVGENTAPATPSPSETQKTIEDTREVVGSNILTSLGSNWMQTAVIVALSIAVVVLSVYVVYLRRGAKAKAETGRSGLRG